MTVSYFTERIGLVMKKSWVYAIVSVFVFATAYLMAFAFWHRTNTELLFLILSIYALVSVSISFLSVYLWKRTKQRAKAASNRRLHRFLTHLSTPAMLWDDGMNHILINDRLRKIIGTDAESEETPDPNLLLPLLFNKEEFNEDALKEIVSSNQKEYSFMTENGVRHDMIWNTSVVETDDKGISKFISIGTDLAEIRAMESELKYYTKKLAASEGKHALSMELTEIGILLGEQGSRLIFPSKELQKMLGLSGDAVRIEELRSHIYPEDCEVFDRHILTMRHRMHEYLNEIHTMELRLYSADGQLRWYTYRFKATRMTDSGKLVVGGAILDQTTEKEKDAEIERIAYMDSVTEGPNRNRLMQVGSERYHETEHSDAQYWVIALDIDKFHLINDTCGYDSGNELLRHFFHVIMNTIGAESFAARISGDNFALIVPCTEDDNFPQQLLADIQAGFGKVIEGTFANSSLTCSAGYAKMPQDGKSFEEVLEHAEFALSVTRPERSCVNPYTHKMHDTIIHENDIEMRLTDAVRQQSFVLFYQPKISLKDGSVIGLEALVRWKQPDGSLLMPGDFIPIAEKSLLITEITRFVLHESCRQLKEWQVLGLPKLVVSINVSSTDFYQNNLHALVTQALDTHQIEPCCLEIELTETLALKDIDVSIAQMEQIRASGIQLAMDDFGTGYSSLGYIQQLPFTMLKLDRQFVSNMTDDPVVQEILSSIVRIAKAKHVETIAEGVETAEQAKQLRLCGCEYGQGYLYGKPMPADQIETFIRDNLVHKKVY